MEKSNIRKLAAGLLLSASLFIGHAVQADGHLGPPSTFEVQGKLLDASGDVVADGEYAFLVAIGDDNTEAPTVYWPEQDPSTDGLDLEDIGAVNVVDGIYNFEVGPVAPSILAENEAYLWVWVEGETFGPQEINSVPYAIVAGTAVTANSVADGSITAESLADGAVTASKIAPGAIGDVLVDEEGTVTLAQTIDSVNLLRDAVRPTVTSQSEYIIVAGESLNETNPFEIEVPSFVSAITNDAIVDFTVEVLDSDLPDSITFVDNVLKSDGAVPSDDAGVYTLTMEITDFLGQTTELAVTITILNVELKDFTAEITDGANLGDDPSTDFTAFAGDEVTFSFRAVTDDPTTDTPYDLDGFTIQWFKEGEDDPIATTQGSEGEDGVYSYVIDGLVAFEDDSDEGTYSAKVILDFDQELAVGDGKIGAIDPGFEIGTIVFEDDTGPVTPEAGSSGTLSISDVTADDVVGSLEYSWFSVTGDGDPVLLGTTEDNEFDLDNLRQGVQGKALMNGGEDLYDDYPAINDGDDTFYYVVASNSFAEQRSAPEASGVIVRIDDNINVATFPKPRTEYAGYPLSFGVVAGITNGAGELSFEWKLTDADGSDTVGTDSNSLIIAGDDVIPELEEVFVVLRTEDGDDLIALEDTRQTAEDRAELDINVPIIPVTTDGPVVYENNDSTPDVFAELGSVNSSYAGVSEVNGVPFTVGDPSDVSVNAGDDVSFQVVFYVPQAQTSSEDKGMYADSSTPPSLDYTIDWWLDLDPSGDPEQDLAMPSIFVTETYKYIEDAGDDGADRVAVVSTLTLEEVQKDGNNVAEGRYFVEISAEPFGTVTQEVTELFVNED